MSTTPKEIENEILSGLTLHLVVISKQIWKYFLNLIRKHFAPRHKLSKLFNRNTIKKSYSCMQNIKVEIRKKKDHKNDTELTENGITKRNIQNKVESITEMPSYNQMKKQCILC